MSRFVAGQKVTLALSKHYRPPVGQYHVVCEMPGSGPRAQYRIKGELEKYERVIDEANLELA